MRLTSKFALLDVTHGGKQIAKMVSPDAPPLPDGIPVVIHGRISHRHDAGRGKAMTFAIDVERVEAQGECAMPTKATAVKIKTDAAGKTTVEPVKAKRSVSQSIGADKKAKRTAEAYARSAKGKTTIAKVRT